MYFFASTAPQPQTTKDLRPSNPINQNINTINQQQPYQDTPTKFINNLADQIQQVQNVQHPAV